MPVVRALSRDKRRAVLLTDAMLVRLADGVEERQAGGAMIGKINYHDRTVSLSDGRVVSIQEFPGAVEAQKKWDDAQAAKELRERLWGGQLLIF